MNEYFQKFIDNISLTKNQRDDSLTKYNGVCKTLNSEFYSSEYSDSVKFLFGSYKKKTTISHPGKDVDVIFKIPKERFEDYQKQENGPSNLLTKVKNTLKDAYSTTDKIKNWTKVVVVDFSTFKVEILPAFEKDNGNFIVPNTGDGKDWIIFDPKSEIVSFENSNNSNNGLTRNLIKIVKKWKIETGNINIKTYILDKYVIDFLNNYSFTNYPKTISDFFEYLHEKEMGTNIETAKNRAGKAYTFYQENNIEKAVEEYQKIFVGGFPKNIKKDASDFVDYVKAPNEQFIEDFFQVSLDDKIDINIETRCKPKKGGFMKSILLNRHTKWLGI